MINIGLDISIHSTGICCEKDDKRMFILVVSSEKRDKILKKMANLNDVIILNFERSGDNLTDGKRAGHCAAQAIKELQRIWKDNKLAVLKEDFAYAAQWNTLTQLVEYTSLFVDSFQTELGVTVHSYAPKHIKKLFTGNGNADKTKMHLEFLNRNLNGDFSNFCKQYDIAKPHTNDLIDAFAIVECLRKIMNEQ